jgi:hypothetical protein
VLATTKLSCAMRAARVSELNEQTTIATLMPAPEIRAPVGSEEAK